MANPGFGPLKGSHQWDCLFFFIPFHFSFPASLAPRNRLVTGFGHIMTLCRNRGGQQPPGVVLLLAPPRQHPQAEGRRAADGLDGSRVSGLGVSHGTFLK